MFSSQGHIKNLGDLVSHLIGKDLTSALSFEIFTFDSGVFIDAAEPFGTDIEF
jgi:hypothetical protein